MRKFNSIMSAITMFFTLCLAVTANAAPAARLHRRAPISVTANANVPSSGNVVVKSYSFDVGTSAFSVNLYVKNLAFQKTVQVCYSNTNNQWGSNDCIAAAYVSSLTNGYELWSFSTVASDFGLGSQFYASATQNSAISYDNNNSKNYVVSVPVQVYSFQCTAGTVSGSLQLQNLGFAKTATLYFSSSSGSWTPTVSIAASFASGPNANGFENWTFSGSPAGIGAGSQFYVAYSVNGQTYYDNNGGVGVNYMLPSSCFSGTTTTTSTTATTTSTTASTTATSTTASTSSTTPTTVSTTTTTASSATTSPTTGSCPLYSGKGIFFNTYKSGSSYLAVEALNDNIFHFEVSALRAPPKGSIWNSPMVDTDNFATNFKGPSALGCSSNGLTLTTPRVKVTIDPASLSVTVFDLKLNVVLSTFSYNQLSSGVVNSISNPPTPQLIWTREKTQAVYGIAQSPGFDSNATNSEGNFLGKQISSPNGYGNVMTCNVNGGCFSYTQFPVVYSFAPSGYQHAFFLDVPQTLSWDLTSSNHKVTATAARALRWFTVAGDSFLDLRKQYMNIIGKASLPPKSALGYNQAKFGYLSFDAALSELKGLYNSNIPVDVMIFDLYWFGEVLGSGGNSKFGSLVWDPTNFANPAQRILELRSYGPGVSMIEEPYLGQNGPTAAFFKGLPNGLIYDVNGSPFLQSNNWWGSGYEIDHTSPAATLWAECKRCRLISGCTPDPNLCPSSLETTQASTEILGHWQDLGEPETFDANGVYYGLVEDDGVHMNTHRSVLNVYQMLNTKNLYVNYRNHSLPRRPNALARTGAPGIQRYGGGLWSADIASDRTAMAYHYGTKKHLSAAGLDYHSSDIGGFHRNGCTGTCIHDLYTTWLANAVWFDFPIKPHVDGHSDQSITASAAVMGDLSSNQFNVRIRYFLMPMLYSLSYRASTLGEPILTPMAMAYQNDPNTYTIGNQYKIGPIIATYTADNPYNGQNGRGVYLPTGVDFYSFHTFEVHTGTGAYTADIPYRPYGSSSSITTQPALVQSGSIFPTAWVDNNTKNHRCWDRKTGGPVCPNQWRVYPGPASTFQQYDDDGETMDFLTNNFYTIDAAQVLDTNAKVATITINAAQGVQPAKYPSARQLVVEVVLPAAYTKVVSVTVNGSALAATSATIDPTSGATGWYTTGNGRLLKVYGPLDSINTNNVVTVSFA